MSRRQFFVCGTALLLAVGTVTAAPLANAEPRETRPTTSQDGAPEIRLDVPTSTAFDPLAEWSEGDAAANGSGPAQAPWVDLADLPVPVFDNRIGLDYTMGGNDGAAVSVEMWWYREAAGDWSWESGLPGPRQAPAVGRNRYNEMVMAGGWDENGEPIADTHYYDNGSTEWVYRLDQMPEARAAAGYANFTDEGALYVIGGCTTTECAPASDSVFLLDNWYGEWSAVADYPVPVAFPSCGAWKERIYCTGGHDDTGGISQSYVYDRSTDRWSALPDSPTDSWGAAHAMVDGVLVVSGGVQGGAVTNNTFGYDVKAGAWVDVPNPATARYRGAGGCVRQGTEGRRFITVGGLGGTDTPVGRAEALPGVTDCENGDGVPKVRRYAGDDRYGTAAAVAGLYDAPVQTVFVTTGRTFPDALAASARAASLGVPVLMTSRDELREQTRRQLERLSPESVVVVGGPASVSDDVLDLIDDALGSGTARRLGGANRYEVAAKVATEVESSDTVFIATGMKFPDALAGSAWAGATDAPLLLVQQDRVPQATIGQLERLSPERIVVLGGPATVSGSVVTQLGGYGDVERVGGANRWEVAASVAGRFPDAEPASVASGRTWPDALAGAARAGGGDAPIILVDTDGIPAASRAQLRRLGPLSIEIYGGRDTVSRDVFYELKDLYE